MTRVAQQSGFVLHHHPYGETSLVLEVFTRDYGRLGLIAKGARRARPEVRANLRPFAPLLLSWSGRGELPTLSQVEAQAMPLHFVGTPLLCAFYLNELVLRLLAREDPHEALFSAYATALTELVAGHQEAALRIFEKRLLQAIGYGLVLSHDVAGMSIAADRDYVYVLDQGARQVQTAVGGIAMKGASLLALHGENLSDPEALADAKNLLRGALAPHVGERPLHTRRLFQRLVSSGRAS